MQQIVHYRDTEHNRDSVNDIGDMCFLYFNRSNVCHEKGSKIGCVEFINQFTIFMTVKGIKRQKNG